VPPIDHPSKLHMFPASDMNMIDPMPHLLGNIVPVLLLPTLPQGYMRIHEQKQPIYLHPNAQFQSDPSVPALCFPLPGPIIMITCRRLQTTL